MSADTQTNDFCRAHWPRLYSLARQRGCDPQSAEDAVQEVFLSLVRRQKIAELVLAPLSQQQLHLTVQFALPHFQCNSRPASSETGWNGGLCVAR